LSPYPIGSKLNLLKREKLSDDIVELSQEYCLEALNWLIDSGYITDFQTLPWIQNGALLLGIDAKSVKEPRMVKNVFQLTEH
jgi:phage gp46-like protein